LSSIHRTSASSEEAESAVTEYASETGIVSTETEPSSP
jgi:hypothetical protein